MLFDTMSNLPRYLGLSANLDTAIRWLSTADLNALPLGRTEIDGDNVFINVMEAEPRSMEGANYEVHARYMDLQLDIIGREAFAFACGDLTEKAPLDAEKDIGFLSGASSVQGSLEPGRFVLFFAGEPHMPTLMAGDKTVRKAVCKIRDIRG